MKIDYISQQIQAKKLHKEKCVLYSAEEDNDDIESADMCSGCGGAFEKGEIYISGIESCCGTGCVRSLCAMCIRLAFEIMFPS